MGVIGRVKPHVVALRTLVPLKAAVPVSLRNRHDASAGIATRASSGNRLLLQLGRLIVGHLQLEGRFRFTSVAIPSAGFCALLHRHLPPLDWHSEGYSGPQTSRTRQPSSPGLPGRLQARTPFLGFVVVSVEISDQSPVSRFRK